MYVPGTILTLKDQRETDPETGEVYAYNEIEFVTTSPVSILDTEGWTGEDATFCVLVPRSNFGGTINRPFGQIRELYEIKSVPAGPGLAAVDALPEIKSVEQQEAERAALIAERQLQLKAQRPPEQVFAEEAPGKAPEAGEIRARTTSPLPDIVAPGRKDPLAPPATKPTRKPRSS